uniref:RRM domain-containing protein n=1 Tax=Glycine max TaxID=3847 RepID=A0A0R0IXV2_SOYBN
MTSNTRSARINGSFMPMSHPLIQMHVITLLGNVQTSKQAWNTLNKRYASKTCARIMYLKECLTHFTKGSLSMTDYLHGIKSLTDELTIINAPLDDVDLVIHTLNGLGVEYKEVSVALHTREKPIDFEELHDLLSDFESYLKRDGNNNYTSFVAIAHASHKGKQPYHKKSYNPNHGSSSNRSTSPLLKEGALSILTNPAIQPRDHKDITSFYFTRFADDITEKELWHHFKKWRDVREIFIPNRGNYMGKRYGFVRFKGVRDIPYMTRQLDRIVIGGMKLYVNLPKYGRELPRKVDSGIKIHVHKDRTQTEDARARQACQINPASYVDALTRTISLLGQRVTSNNRVSSTSSVHIDIRPEDTKWLKMSYCGRQDWI